ncbi:MAG: GTPase ObgE [Candidatus Omnitrophica bacterium]|nr:GTPase ObgE [Candidatus Omnitrophota bacterium]
MFIDRTKIHLKAGDGGNGCNSFDRHKIHRRGRPNGGEGGDGGNILIVSDRNIQTLLDFQYNRHFKARSGRHGSSNRKRGRNGEDLIVRVPPGTVIIDAASGKVLRDLSSDSQRVVVARGGNGGSANSRFRLATDGGGGEERDVTLELKLIAEVGIVGYPNAGKSTLISSISNTRPKIASYPFTTKEPMLGVVKTEERDFIIADIPGLIKGAHLGKGLGHQFLRHVERTKVLLHLVDVAGIDGRDPVSDYHTLNEELGLYSKRLLKKTQIVAANKIDLPQAKTNMDSFAREINKKVYPVSALKRLGLDKLISAILETL